MCADRFYFRCSRFVAFLHETKMAAKKEGATLSLADLSALGAEDRMAVMNMVKDGEVSIDEAIARVKGEAMLKAGKVSFSSAPFF